MKIVKNLKIAALIFAAVLAAAPMSGCKDSNKDNSIVYTNYAGKTYAEIPGVAEIEHKLTMNEQTEVKGTSYKLNRMIDSGIVKDGTKFIYADVTITNNTDTACEYTAINNFYIILPDKTEVSPAATAQVYALNHLDGFEKLSVIDAGQEWNGYVSFALAENVGNFSFCFFPTGKDYNDKENYIRTEIASADLTPAPEGMFN